MRPSSSILRPVLVALLTSLATPLGAQTIELGAFASLGRTGIRELGNPAGFGISVTWPMGNLAGFRFEGSRMTSSPQWAGFTCERYSPSTDCRHETVESDVRGSHFATSLVAVPLRHDGWRIEAILGISRIYLVHEIGGVESGRLADQSSDEEGAFRPSYGAALVREGLGTGRLGARLEWRHAGMRGNVTTCVPEACPVMWDDFGMDELRLGALWRF